MSAPFDRLDAVYAALLKKGLPDVEVYAKRGRSRRFDFRQERRGERVASASFQEKGWAVRAGDRRGSLFVTGTGDPDPAGPLASSGGSGWPAAYGPAIRLPNPVESSAPPWKEPRDFDAPLAAEREGLALLEGIAKELAAELPGARLERALLEDGSSESDLVSSRGMRTSWRARACAIHLEAIASDRNRSGESRPSALATLDLAEREVRRFQPKGIARRLADRLHLANAEPLAKDATRTGDALLAPPVAARLLAAIAPLFIGPHDEGEISALFGDPRRIASERVTIVDDGRLAGGLFEAAVDGEGVPTAEVVVVERGVFRGPLLAWWHERQGGDGSPGSSGTAAGISRRASWRELPSPGPSHFYLAPDPAVSVSSLVAALGRGAYLIDALGPARLDLARAEISIPVCGFEVEKGRAEAPIGRALLVGDVADFLRGLIAVARDLAFTPMTGPPGGALGSPTILVRGLSLRGG